MRKQQTKKPTGKPISPKPDGKPVDAKQLQRLARRVSPILVQLLEAEVKKDESI